MDIDPALVAKLRKLNHGKFKGITFTYSWDKIEERGLLKNPCGEIDLCDNNACTSTHRIKHAVDVF